MCPTIKLTGTIFVSSVQTWGWCQSSQLTLSKKSQNILNISAFTTTFSSDVPLWFELPHGIQQCPVIFDPQQFIRHGHVMSHRLLSIVEEGVRSPDFTRHQVVERQNIHWPVKFQPLVLPALPEKNIYGVLLWAEEIDKSNYGAKLLLILLLINLFYVAALPQMKWVPSLLKKP